MADPEQDDLREVIRRQVALRAAMARQPSYAEDAFLFVCAGVNYTCARLGGRRDVSGRELIDGLCDLAVERFGFLAPTVLERWGIKGTDDLGEIVFALVEVGLLGKSPRDSKDDFHDVLDLRETLRARHRIDADAEI